VALITTETGKKTKVFFENLNGVRCIAALMVVIAHIELHKQQFNIEKIPGIKLSNLGHAGVTIFFSLSGFLITYLLLEEKRNYIKVNFKDFYLRRILRIWPLYFLVVLFGFFVYPGFDSAGLWLSIFFLPNVAFISQLLPAIIDPIWSIGIEEQFYIFHPHFFRIKKVEYILYALVGFIVFFFLVALFLRFLNHHNTHETVLNQFFYYARYDDMVIGAIAAVLYFNTKHPTFKFRFQGLFNLMFNKYVQILLLLAFWGFIWVYITYETPQGDVILSILSAMLIINLCEAKTSIYSLKHNVFQFTGKISYGIYLLHKFPLFLVLYLVNKYFSGESQITKNVMVYIATLVLAIALASLSYYGYERYFLTLKKRFQKITQ